jgi:hypothetical protein
MASQELAKWEASMEAIPAPVLAMARALDVESSLDDSGVSPATLDIMARILEAEGEDAVFAAANGGTLKGKDFTGVPFLLHAEKAEVKRSAAMFTEQGAFPYYMLARVTNLQTGEVDVPLSCGGFSYMTTYWRLRQLGILQSYSEGMPLILTGKPAARGTVLLLNKYVIPTMPSKSSKSSNGAQK